MCSHQIKICEVESETERTRFSLYFSGLEDLHWPEKRKLLFYGTYSDFQMNEQVAGIFLPQRTQRSFQPQPKQPSVNPTSETGGSFTQTYINRPYVSFSPNPTSKTGGLFTPHLL